MKHRCSRTVWSRGRYRHSSPCSRAGVIEEAGQWWCKFHAPSKVKAKRDAMDRLWALQEEVRKCKDALAESKEILVGHICNTQPDHPCSVAVINARGALVRALNAVEAEK